MTRWDIPEDSPSGRIGYLGASRDEWRVRAARRAVRWAAEDAVRYAAWERHQLDRAATRSAQWPIARIRALMTATHREGADDDLDSS